MAECIKDVQADPNAVVTVASPEGAPLAVVMHPDTFATLVRGGTVTPYSILTRDEGNATL